MVYDGDCCVIQWFVVGIYYLVGDGGCCVLCYGWCSGYDGDGGVEC